MKTIVVIEDIEEIIRETLPDLDEKLIKILSERIFRAL